MDPNTWATVVIKLQTCEGRVLEEVEALGNEVQRPGARVDSHFRWVIGLMIPIVLGVLAIIRVFFLGPIP